ncbi:TonB-dependent receptor [Spongiibacter nanhainus]|uniref:TonB-dependent receptor n=1 Tax=Spongiibacter nanhainus TaxID=2794344 RepID=A0A7T4UP02_9GAMM|nr:TonB-dependent receptor [Spongiibacter nanhainus]QQD17092.1 TonB-dependent receptor [Spongiibacter nanhainus]
MMTILNPGKNLKKAALALSIACVYSHDVVAAALEEVVVTAQRRAESVQDTPVAITGLADDALDKLGFESANDISAQVPNMQVSGPYGEVQPIFAIRGVSMSDYSSNQASPIGVYVDEAYLGAVFTHGTSFFDVERLEVLRGPQGTLYGKNTTGGAINVITKTPMINDPLQGKIKAGIGNFGMRNLEGAVGNTLIEDKLAARLAFKIKENDGVQENKGVGDDRGLLDFSAARLALNWQITDDLNAVFKYTHATNRGNMKVPIAEGRTDVRGIEGLVLTHPYETNGFIDYTGYDRSTRGLGFHDVEDNTGKRNRNDFDMDLFIATLNYESDYYSITSVTSYYDTQLDKFTNDDGSPTRLLEIDWYTASESFSQDIRFASNFDGNFQIIGGLYYGLEELEMHNIYELFGDLLDPRAAIAKPDLAGQAPFVLDFGAVDQRQNTEKESLAAYTQMRWDVTANLGVDLGLRYTQDTNRQTYINVSRVGLDGAPRGTFVPGNTTGYDQAFVPVFLPPVLSGNPDDILSFLANPLPYLNNLTQYGLPGFTEGPYTLDSGPKLESTEREWTGKLGVDYRLSNEWMVYASYSMGYRAGAFNSGIYYESRPLDTAYANPEYIDAYEVGFKADLLDNSLRINAAAFYYEYTDQQFINVVGISNFLENAGASEILGVEAEIWWRASERLTLQLGVGLLETEYTELELRDTSTLADLDDTVELSGNELISAPPLNVSVSADYDLYVGETGYLSLNVNANYQDEQWFSAYNDAVGYDQGREEAYTIYNARLGWYSNDGRYQIALWGKNITDEEYKTYSINLQASFGLDYYMTGDPMMYGIEASYNF